MRSASYSFRRVVQWTLLVVGLLAFATLLGRTQTKINPNTQINWPAGCGVYNVSANACPPVTGITFKGAWSSVVTYAVNDAVYDSGSTYVSLQAGNLNHNPLTSPTFWTLLASGSSAGGPNLSIQFNNGGALGGSAAIETDAANQALLINALNPTPGASACALTPALCVNGLWNSPTQAAAEADPIGIYTTPVMAYPGFQWGNAGAGGWSTQKGNVVNMADFTRGIGQGYSSLLQKFATGDIANYFYNFSYGGTTSQSDEGVASGAFQAVQFGSFYEGTVNAGQTTGTQTLAATITNSSPTCDGCYLVNRTTGAITGGYFVPFVTITAWTFDGTNTFVFTAANSLVVGQGVYVYGFASDQWINGNGTVTVASGTQFTLVTSGISHAAGSATEIGAGRFGAFQVAGTAAMEQQVGGISLTPTVARGTVNTVMPVNGTTTPLIFTLTVDVTDNVSSFPTTSPPYVGCLTGGQPEQVLFTAAAPSGGHQSISITYRQPHGTASITDPATTLWYGGPCGMVIDQLQQTASTRPNGKLPSTYFVVGATDSSHIAYAWNIRGGTLGNAIPTYQNIVPYTSALRLSNTVTASIFPGFGSSLNGSAAVTVVASTNAVFLGTGTAVAQTLNSIGIANGIAFTQAGSNGDTATAILVSLPTSADAISLYCAAELVSPSTPSPGAPATLHLEPNRCPWNSGDTIWNPPHPSYNTEGLFENVVQNTPSNSGLSDGISLLLQGPGIDGNFIPFFVQYTDPITAYAGHGGTMNAGPFMRVQSAGSLAPFSSLISVSNSGVGGAPLIRVDSDEYGNNLTFQVLAEMEAGTIGYFNPTQTWFLNNISTGAITANTITGNLSGNLLGNWVPTIASGYACMENLLTSICTNGVTNNNYQQNGLVFDTLHNIFGSQYGQGGDLRLIAETPGGNSAFLAGVHLYGDLYTTTASLAGQIILNGTNPNAYLIIDGTINGQGNILIGYNPGSASVGGYALQVKNNLLADNLTSPSVVFQSGGVFPARTNTAGNTDVNGHLTMTGGVATYSFTSTGITTAPECTASDYTSGAAVKVVVTTTALQLTGTPGDIAGYICSGHN